MCSCQQQSATCVLYTRFFISRHTAYRHGICYGNSPCLSVCLSVTLVSCVERVRAGFRNGFPSYLALLRYKMFPNPHNKALPFAPKSYPIAFYGLTAWNNLSSALATVARPSLNTAAENERVLMPKTQFVARYFPKYRLE